MVTKMGPQMIMDRVKEYDPNADFDLIAKAYNYAVIAHGEQKRKSGEPYIIHPVEVALILTEIEMDSASICAALLHDVIEDTSFDYKNLEQEFGEEIAMLVEGVTKLSRINFKTREEAQAENLRKMFLAMANDIRVVLIKLADRLHNMRTLNYQPESRQKQIAQETMDIFAPLAHRLGVFKFKWQLEDLAFLYLQPEMYHEVAQRLKTKRKEREAYVNALIQQIRKGLEQIGIEGDIAGRPKNIYSIYKKMLKQDKSIDEIYDKIAIRVIVDTVPECYGVLGIIHTMWKPLPGRFKDYIATPKPNMYQSLHTTLIGQGGEPFEVQIRTWEMHLTAESGIAAHWHYKQDGSPKDRDKKFDEKLAWLRRILEWQQDVNDGSEFMESLKTDLFEDTVFIFTPKGDVIELPKGSCPVDFAYRVHTEVGHKCTGARVNGRIVPLDYQLSNGDIVEIITSKSSLGPTRGWLDFVKTSSARSRIKAWFKRSQRQENVLKGHELLEAELRKRHLDSKELLKEGKLSEVLERFSLSTLDDLFSAVGDGSLTANQVANRIKESYFPNALVEDIINTPLVTTGLGRERVTRSLRVKGVDDIVIRLAHCCNPLPGDKVLGYITRGRGVSVHRTDCPNMQNYLRNESNRILEMEWTSDKGNYMVEIEIDAIDRDRLTSDVMTLIADMRIPVNSVFSRATKNGLAVMNLKLEILDMTQLHTVKQRLQKVKGVQDIRRVLPGDRG
ncbi:MAG TPA: bifunctional (p)ppGpp synthetase/guanosine-3',5'-bis(diphosphate) 3'-pyrophosphohydrolase [Syntrophomonadaceae bacterium]|jgi:GTP pyrophosphokinase|nr:bifunctional (p)ppGpp synthetase/guanosine-3',5'-bis(diphosphate) 3'-pyrophosphohydrolase [Syntrophomonadaceae bacterium]